MIFPYVWVGVISMIGILPVHTVAIFLTLVIAISNAKIMMHSVEGGIEMIADLDVKTANLQLFFSVLLAASLIIAGLF
jgi:1,4-dihydroxy-2-naphthoate octaprenyltransferase